MKLLIVDDEELTRTGVISSLDWSSLGIDEVIQADDGVHGLETARLYKPEIILCDVRMPRMDGITMLERLEKLLPDSVAIFMSGYSAAEKRCTPWRQPPGLPCSSHFHTEQTARSSQA